MKLRKSPFLHTVPVSQGITALYHSLNLEVVFLESTTAQRICSKDTIEADDSEVFTSLSEAGLLIGESDDGFLQLKEYVSFLKEPSINILYLLLTDACNIRCKYCYFLSPMPCGYKRYVC
jgi:uncharacterized protein